MLGHPLVEVMFSFFELTTFLKPGRASNMMMVMVTAFLRCIRYPESFASNKNKDTN